MAKLTTLFYVVVALVAFFWFFGVPSIAKADFGEGAVLIDDFQGGPWNLSGGNNGWQQWPAVTSNSMKTIANAVCGGDNECAQGFFDQENGSYRTTSGPWADQEAYVTHDNQAASVDGRFTGVCVRVTTVGYGICTIAARTAGSTKLQLVEVLGGWGNPGGLDGLNILSATSQTCGPGCKFGVQAVGNTARAFYDGGSGWVQVAEECISGIAPTSGHPGLLAHHFQIVVDDMFAGPTSDYGTEECGDTVPQIPECDDDIDNDGDTLIDFPQDSGCLSSTDPSEQTQVGAGEGGGLPLVDFFTGGIIGILTAIFCLLQNLLHTFLAAIILAFNEIIAALASVIQSAIDLLPPMPTLPAVPDEVKDGFAYGGYFFPLGFLLTLLALLALLWLTWFVVAIPLRWGKMTDE